MNRFVPIIFFLCISRNVLGQWMAQERIDYEDELSYQELINMNASCYPSDSCMEDRKDNPYFPAFGYSCSCHRQCWELGTCCIDSPYRNKAPIQECRNAGVTVDNLYYMVYRCPDNTDTDSIWKSECEKEWNGEDDILMLSPVTSLDTSVTYKNYFCFRCHESTDKYISWDLSVDSIYSDSNQTNVYSVSYDLEQNTWMAIFDENSMPIPANMTFQFPYNVNATTISCDRNTIADCPHTWTDRRVREKCLSYTAVIYSDYLSYKNVHCALCNYESLGNLTCRPTVISAFGKGIFSFRHLLDINTSDGDKVGKDGKCDNDHTWDPYSKKCRKKTCALPGYVIKDDRCVPP